MNYAEEIRKHDTSFYEAIAPSIHKMPVFRPSNTLKQMRQESQNNWRLLYEEMDAITYNEKHMALLTSINNKNKDIEVSSMVDVLTIMKSLSTLRLKLRKWRRAYQEESYTREEIEGFFFSYPALSWCLLHIIASETMAGSLIYHGLFLSEIPMKKEYVSFIRSLHVAKELYALYPHLINLDDDEYRKLPNTIESLGYIYWIYVADPKHRIFTVVYSAEIGEVYLEHTLNIVKKGNDYVFLNLLIESARFPL